MSNGRMPTAQCNSTLKSSIPLKTLEILIGETAMTSMLPSASEMALKECQADPDANGTRPTRLSRVSCTTTTTNLSEQSTTTDLMNESVRKFELRINKLQKRERQSALLLGSIILTFIACWLPFFTVYVMQAVCCSAPEFLFDLVFFIGYINSLLNPLVYGLFNAEIRTAFVRTIKKLNTAGSTCISAVRHCRPVLN